ncbi:MAG TPA: 30S ribosome-binding factor RbfA [Gaiellales bacterium]|nr:30S ribosome-binding factor RbfA [Gaiellales bacterium]
MSERMRRVNESLREVLADAVERLGDPRIGFVTVTAVRSTSDLRHADVFVSVLGGQRRRRRSLLALQHAHGVLQQAVAREMHLRRTPQLAFIYDETLDRALRLNTLIDEAGTVPGSDTPE